MTEWPINRIRRTFIDYFTKKQNHVFTPSSSVVPREDPTLLFANAGMNQFKPVLLGQVDPNSPLSKLQRAANSQKCLRAGGKHNDLEDAGKDTSHHTFFEMLGNWSFGDYFKKDAIDFAMDLLVNVYKIDKTRLYVSYFSGNAEQQIPRDTETRDLWRKHFPEKRILPFAMKENFWEMGDTGPCGPCTEIHYDFVGRRDASKLVNTDCPEVVELWNIVFIQFDRRPGGRLEQLPRAHVDTGMGLERLACVLQGKRSNYDTDAFSGVFGAIQKATQCEKGYGGRVGDGEEARTDVAYRIVADHMRSLVVAIADGAVPDCVGRGYVLRRILRRALRAGKALYCENQTGYGPFLHKIVPAVAEYFRGTFDDIPQQQPKIQAIIKAEEESFLLALDKGEAHLDKVIRRLAKAGCKTVPGEDVFFLYSSFGFPSDLTAIAAAERGLSVDFDGFAEAKRRDQLLSKAASGKRRGEATGPQISAKEMDFLARNGVSQTNTGPQYETVGSLIDAKVLAVKSAGRLSVSGGRCFQSASENHSSRVALILDRTNFYAEAGGQIYDIGEIESAKAKIAVDSVQTCGGYVLHFGQCSLGEICVGENVHLKIDRGRRGRVMSNHTMTHVLNHSIRKVLGGGADQRGSRVLPGKLVFDFSSKALTPGQVGEIEALTKASIARKRAVFSELVPLKAAKEINGVRAIFGEAYPDPVRVVAIGRPVRDILRDPRDPSLVDLSIELCGGTHLQNTAEAEEICVVSETGVAKGTRRIVAVTKEEAKAALNAGHKLLCEYEKAANFKYEELSLFLTAKSKKSTTISYSHAKQIKQIEAKLQGKLREQIKRKQKEAEVNVLEAVRIKLKDNGNGDTVASKSKDNTVTSKKKALYEIVTSKSKDTVVLFVEETLCAKTAKKVVLCAKGMGGNRNAMCVSFCEDRKGARKLLVSCAVAEKTETIKRNSGRSPSAKEWVEFAMAELGGKGSGGVASAQGQAPLKKTEEVQRKLEAFREFGDGFRR